MRLKPVVDNATLHDLTQSGKQCRILDLGTLVSAVVHRANHLRRCGPAAEQIAFLYMFIASLFIPSQVRTGL